MTMTTTTTRPPTTTSTRRSSSGGQSDDQTEVIARFRAGDEDAIRTLYRSHRGAIFTVARSVTGDRELANDVVQQTFVKAWQASDRFRADGAVAPWLYAIARRTAVDAVRHERRPTIGGHDPEVDRGVPGPSFEQTWIVHEVREAIDSLPACEQDIVRLSHLAGVPHTEIARRLGLPVGTVKSRSVRAHRRLAERLAHLRESPIEGEPPRPRVP